MTWLKDRYIGSRRFLRKSSVSLSDMYIHDYHRPDWQNFVSEKAKFAEQNGYYEESRCLQFDRRCFLTGKKLFFKKAVRMSFQIDGPPEEKFVDHEIWICRNAYLLMKMK